jgi:RNA polymerase sigma factor (sigma-70 family)
VDPTASDEQLVEAARAGDRRALAVLLERHRPLLLSVCTRATGDPLVAEDAAQDAALQAFLALDRLRHPAWFGSWLAGIGLNMCHRARRNSRDAWSWEPLAGGRWLPEPADDAPGPELLAEAEDVRAAVRHAVAQLPPGQRAAPTLFYLEGLTVQETAELLGVGPGAVKTRMHKARRTLRRALRAWDRVDAGSEGVVPMIEMRLRDVRRQPGGSGLQPGGHVAVLEEIGGTQTLPVWMGAFEATALAIQLERVALPRPLTYAFAAGVLPAAGGKLREVRIERLNDDTFYAVAVVEGTAGVQLVDARPSDALNLALALDAPIKVDRSVLESVNSEPQRRDRNLSAATEGTAEIVVGARAGWAKRAPRSIEEE